MATRAMSCAAGEADAAKSCGRSESSSFGLEGLGNSSTEASETYGRHRQHCVQYTDTFRRHASPQMVVEIACPQLRLPREFLGNQAVGQSGSAGFA